ncbi:MAG: hypothetical protein COS15_01935 [Caldiserica bacterium CG02_land_8_20_14_3_00_36_38]|nr:MAG: hypothetical protein COS15_01935 [Caldiserica bacterium CG02_land_8_20_14_3_00_36_38]PIW10764.1 MAG: hypothetical protein COW37_02310 [Caldiserica bacterium CG17_big_fil_post_rev_8_21_14_2_50_35_7]
MSGSKPVAIISLSFIFGMIFGWLEEISLSLYIPIINIINFYILTFLISLLVLLILISISDNFILSISSVVVYGVSYIFIKIFLLHQTISYVFTTDRIVSLSIIFFFSFVEAVFTGYYKVLKNRYRDKIDSIKLRKDFAFPIIILLLSIVFSSIFVLLDRNISFLQLPFNNIYVFLFAVLLLSLSSMNEISGFFIGFFSLSIYFLLLGLISIDFNLAKVSQDSRIIYTIELFYSTLFAISSFLISRSSRLFIKGILSVRKITIPQTEIEKQIKQTKPVDSEESES